MCDYSVFFFFFFFFQAEDGIRDLIVTGVQTCALPISRRGARAVPPAAPPHLCDVLGPVHAGRVGGEESRVRGGSRAVAATRSGHGGVSRARRSRLRTSVQLPGWRRRGAAAYPRAPGTGRHELVLLRRARRFRASDG